MTTTPKLKKQRKYINFMATITADRATLPELVKKCQKTTAKNWAIIRHDKDIASDHYHIALHYDSQRPLTTPANQLEIPQNFVAKWDNRTDNLWAYLIHNTTEAKAEKYNYIDYIGNHEKSATNDPDIWQIATKKVRTKTNSNDLDMIQKQILHGELLERDLLTPEMIEYYAKNKRKLDDCLKLRQKSLILNPPTCETIYIYGNSGTGKSTLAERLATASGAVAWASGANDPLQDYNGEPSLILDDFRPQQINFADLLKLLDPIHRKRSHQSRYYNKVLATKKIIITTVMPLDELIRYYAINTGEDQKQLRRRITRIYQTQPNFAPPLIYKYNEQLDDFCEVIDDLPPNIFS